MADDLTLSFLPTRLNAAPVVFRGMTGREVGLVALAGLAAGLPLGLLGLWVVSMFTDDLLLAIVPTIMAVVSFALLWFGGLLMRRLRRGRPETWLYRRLQWLAAHHGFNSAELIVTTTVYRLGRDRHQHPGGHA